MCSFDFLHFVMANIMLRNILDVLRDFSLQCCSAPYMDGDDDDDDDVSVYSSGHTLHRVLWLLFSFRLNFDSNYYVFIRFMR